MLTVRRIKCIKDSLFTSIGDILVEYGFDRPGLFYFETAKKLTGNGLPIDTILKLKGRNFDEYFVELERVDFILTAWGDYHKHNMKQAIESARLHKKDLQQKAADVGDQIFDLTAKFKHTFGVSPHENGQRAKYNLSDEEINYINQNQGYETTT